MRYRYFLSTPFLVASFLNPMIYAATMPSQGKPLGQFHFYGSIYQGASFLNLKNKQNVSLTTENYVNRYVATSNTRIRPETGIRMGIQFPSKYNLFLRMGLGFYHIYKTKVNGDIYQLADPDFNNLRYTYSFASSRIMAEAQLMTSIHSLILPYVSIGVGSAFNQMTSYKETPKYSGVLPMRPFTNNVNESMAYQYGIGVDFRLNQHWLFGLGYQYAYLGKGKLGLSPAQDTKSHFKTKNLDDYNAGIQITWLI